MSTKIDVKIITNSRHDEICGLLGGEVLKIKIKAKPVDGKANEYLIKFLSNKLSIAQNDITIVRGFSSAKKTLEISNLKFDDILKILEINQDEP
ncbi:MAG: DUF167 domain-containing protein [Pelolinea sp.]|nr:DUF167 domain-containing protein [Pelolinea sp.]